MLIDLVSPMLMLCLNICLGDSSSGKVDLNMDWNSSITTYSHLSVTANSSASDFSEFCWITSKCLTVLWFWSVFIAVCSSITFNVNLFTTCCHSFMITNSSASDFSEFCWTTSKCLTVLQFWSAFIAVCSSITFNVNLFTACCHFFRNRWWCFHCQFWIIIQSVAQSIWELVTFSQINLRMRSYS